MENRNKKAWLYLLPAMLFLGAFMVYPLIDVLIYSVEEGYNFVTQSFYGYGAYNYLYVLHDPLFLQALKNTFILVVITVPLSTAVALLISVALSSVKAVKKAFQTIYFLPYVTNTLAVGMVFMVLFDKTEYTDGLFNMLIKLFGGNAVDFINGPYWAKMLVLCLYTVWVVMPFKVLVLTSALASVKKDYYNAAKVDGTSKWRTFTKITVPMISPMLFYLVITGFIGAWNDYMTPYLYLPEFPTLATGIYELRSKVEKSRDPLYYDQWPRMFAVMIWSILPVLVLFIAFQDRIMTMTSGGGIKE